MSSALPNFKDQDPLDVEEIAGIMRILDKTQRNPVEMMLLNHRIYRGVKVMEILMQSAISKESKRVKISAARRVVVLGQVLEEPGKIVCMELGGGEDQRANVTSGFDMENFSIDGTHWCSGLAIMWVNKTTGGGKPGVSSSKRDLKDARKNLAKDMLRIINDSSTSVTAWDQVDWKAFEKKIDTIQIFLIEQNKPTTSRQTAKQNRKQPVSTKQRGPVTKQKLTKPSVSALKNANRLNAPTSTPLQDQQHVFRSSASAKSLPKFELNKFGFLDVTQTKRAQEIVNLLEQPFRKTKGCAEEQEFQDLMNKSYPHAVFTNQIFTPFSEREDNYWKYEELEDVPEFKGWWKQAYVRPPAGKSPSLMDQHEQAARDKFVYPPYLRFRKWLVLGSKGQLKARLSDVSQEPVPSTPENDTENMLTQGEEDPDIDMDQIRAIMASNDQDDDNHDQQS